MTPISYDLKTASAMTGLSPSYLKRALDAGDLRGKRSSRNAEGTPEGKWLIKPGDLQAFVEALPDG